MAAPGQHDPTQNAQPGGPPSAGAGKRNVSVGQILGGLLFLLVIVFIVENSRRVRVRLIFPEVQAPLYVPILIAAVLGGLITWLLRYRRHHRRG
ncbi:MAG TPA: lipopolysaccharide assembly protein LapA domain-containing protein [Jatrophihabitans sp.]|jgi:uncharacterized integral membrane protein|nr:lipopolysaccharide assembly protein LapA domain-containing protein [Jatrophihabitans sp.]